MKKIHFRKIHSGLFLLLCIPAGVMLASAVRAASTHTETRSTFSNSIATKAPGDSLYYGKNMLKYTIDGRHVDIKDALKQGEGKYTTVLYVNNASLSANTITVTITNLITSEVFELRFPATGGSANGTYLGVHGQMHYKTAGVNVQVTSLTTTHIAANFSGKFATNDPKPGSIEVHDGSFDLVMNNK